MGGRSCSIIYHHSAMRFGPSPRGSTGAVPRWAPLAAHQGMECSLSLAQVKGQPGQEQDGLVPPPGPHLTTLEPPCPRQSPVAAGVHFGPSLAHSTTAHTSIIQATKGCCGSDFPGDFMFLSLTFTAEQRNYNGMGRSISHLSSLSCSPWEMWAPDGQPAMPEAAPCSLLLLGPLLQSLTFPFSRGKSLVHPPRVIVKLLWLVF